MRKPTELETQKYQRLIELFSTARQRYLQAGGDPQQSGGSFNGHDHLTIQEKQEIRQLGKQVFARTNLTVNTEMKKY